MGDSAFSGRRAYKIQENTGIAPRLLGHTQERVRVIGLVLEKVEGREAGVEDLSLCRSALQRFHDVGLLHGSVTRYNSIVRDGTVWLIVDHSQNVKSDMESEKSGMGSLYDQLTEETGRGGGVVIVIENRNF